jgi:NAD(P)-dependent dehydrogenase (short-subunit alcohol dehydrogenase family)
MNKFANKIAVVTGGAQGIGKEIVTLLARDYAKVIIVDINYSVGSESASEISALGASVIFLHANISDQGNCKEVFEKVKKEFGGLDILVNNAGVMHSKDGNITDIEDGVWERIFDINVNGTYYCCKYAIPIMVDTGGGSIINTSSFVALRGSSRSRMAYTASKGAILSLTRDLAAAYGAKNIRVNSLCPGPTNTKAFMDAVKFDQSELDGYISQIPMGRFAAKSEIAKAALFLASDDASFVTGTELIVDGGITSSYKIIREV